MSTEWKLVPKTLTKELLDALRSCESGEFTPQDGWDYILAAAPQPEPTELTDEQAKFFIDNTKAARKP